MKHDVEIVYLDRKVLQFELAAKVPEASNIDIHDQESDGSDIQVAIRGSLDLADRVSLTFDYSWIAESRHESVSVEAEDGSRIEIYRHDEEFGLPPRLTDTDHRGIPAEHAGESMSAARISGTAAQHIPLSLVISSLPDISGGAISMPPTGSNEDGVKDPIRLSDGACWKLASYIDSTTT